MEGSGPVSAGHLLWPCLHFRREQPPGNDNQPTGSFLWTQAKGKQEEEVYESPSILTQQFIPFTNLVSLSWQDYYAIISFLAINYLVGYGTGRFFKLHPTICRTLSIEVAMQNDWLALHIVRGTHTPLLYIFPVIFYSAMQAMVGPLVMAIFKHMYQSEQINTYISENVLHDSFRGPGHFASDDAEQISLQTRHNKAVCRIFGTEEKRRYGKPIWFLSRKVKESFRKSKSVEGSDQKERLVDNSNEDE